MKITIERFGVIRSHEEADGWDEEEDMPTLTIEDAVDAFSDLMALAFPEFEDFHLHIHPNFDEGEEDHGQDGEDKQPTPPGGIDLGDKTKVRSNN
jgi:hypothetical protein